MGMVRALLVAVALGLPAVPAHAEDPDILAPYRFTGPLKELTPVERQRALVYRNELQSQQHGLEQDDLRGQLDPLDRRRLLDTRSELGRMNKVLLPPASTGTGASGSRTLPSLSGRSPLLAP